MSWTPLLLLIGVCWTSAATDGQWAEWSDWTSCSVSCQRGVQKRIRACSPPPRVGGRWCQGKYVQTKNCETGVPCPVDGGWSDWSPWSRCSVSCGQGAMERYRSCSAPIPEQGGKKCNGPPRESQSCVALKECPRDGGWSPWSRWSACSVTCGAGGSAHRYRSCNNPPPVAEGRPCPGTDHEVQVCQSPLKCLVNGQWSEWSAWSECSVSCGRGERTRQRACDNPPPLYGGAECDRTDAAELQTISCNAHLQHCPVDGGWSIWSRWRACHSPDCGSSAALSFRHRSCNHPLPAHNGTMCQGTFLDAGLCAHPVNCRVDGGWSEWSEWNCTRFVASRRRTCDDPTPSNGGSKCEGKEIQFHVREDDVYRDACPQFPTDDEDLEESSGMQASGSGEGAE